MSKVRLKAQDTNGKSVSATFTVSLYNPGSEDLLLYRRAYSSSDENSERVAAFAIDGDEETRWSSVYSDDQWIAVELEEVKTIEQVQLLWESAYGGDYEIQVSGNGDDWTTVYHETAGDGGLDKISFDEVEAKYVRMKGNQRATDWGFSLFAFQAFAQGDDTSIGGLPAGEHAVLIHPNPVEDHLIVSFKIPVHEVALLVYNLSGQKVVASDLKNGTLQNHSLDVSSLEKGFYFLEISIGQHVERQKFVKK